MSKKQRTPYPRRPKWVFEAKSSFLTIHEFVFTKRRLNRLCKLAMDEKIRFERIKIPTRPVHLMSHDFEKLTVNIQPYSYAISSQNKTGTLRSGSFQEVHAAHAGH